jgi:hypothetical protein
MECKATVNIDEYSRGGRTRADNMEKLRNHLTSVTTTSLHTLANSVYSRADLPNASKGGRNEDAQVLA